MCQLPVDTVKLKFYKHALIEKSNFLLKEIYLCNKILLFIQIKVVIIQFMSFIKMHCNTKNVAFLLVTYDSPQLVWLYQHSNLSPWILWMNESLAKILSIRNELGQHIATGCCGRIWSAFNILWSDPEKDSNVWIHDETRCRNYERKHLLSMMN